MMCSLSLLHSGYFCSSRGLTSDVTVIYIQSYMTTKSGSNVIIATESDCIINKFDILELDL